MVGSLTHRRSAVVSLQSLALVAGASGLLLLIGCGGGGGSSAAAPAPPPPPPAVTTLPEGVWSGNQSYSNKTLSTTAVAIVLGSGESRIITGTGYQDVGTIAAGLESGTAYSIFGFPAAPFAMTVTAVTPKVSFAADLTLGTDATSFTFDKYAADYDTPLAPATLAGSFVSPKAVNTLSKDISLTLNSDGSFTGGTAAGDTLVGTFTIPDPTKSAVKLTFMFTPAGGTGETLSGLASYVIQPPLTVPSLSFIVSGPTKTMVASCARLP